MSSKITQFIYPAAIERDDDGWWQVRFPDLPDALTDGETKEEAIKNAADCLNMALYARVENREGIPVPSAVKQKMVPITPDPDISLKAALHSAMLEQSITMAELARRLNTDHKEARRITDPGHNTKLPRLTQALEALDKHIVIGIQ